MKVAIYGQTYYHDTLEYVIELLDELHKEKAEVFFEDSFYEFINASKVLASYPTIHVKSINGRQWRHKKCADGPKNY